MDYINTVVHANALDYLSSVPEKTFHSCITSPPYFNLRNYFADGQIGNSPTLQGYIDSVCAVMDGVYRALRDDALLWLNLGDSYADKALPGIKQRSLHGTPWRVAIALMDRGWILRNDVVWSKPNPVPSSIKSRMTNSHEYMFLLSKTDRYYYDWYATLEDAAVSGQKRMRRDVWTIGYNTNKGAADVKHQASFPPALITPPVLASPERVCSECGCPHTRILISNNQYERLITPEIENNAKEVLGFIARSSRARVNLDLRKSRTTDYTQTGWQKNCDCSANHVGGLILDPFMGSGTTAVVAKQNGRRWSGCDLNLEYVNLSNSRTRSILV